MADPRLFRLRVTFHETGRLAMLSHLELARALERAVRRAQLPFAVSQGFSPHMRIAFGAALPVGVGGTAEIFDLFLTDYVPAPRALTALQEASPADLYPTEARYIEARDAAASVALPVSTYEVVLSEAPRAVVVPEAIIVVRREGEDARAVRLSCRAGVSGRSHGALFSGGQAHGILARRRLRPRARPRDRRRRPRFGRSAADHLPARRPARSRRAVAADFGYDVEVRR